MDPSSYNRDGREIPRPIEPTHPEEQTPAGSDGGGARGPIQGRNAQREQVPEGNSRPARVQRVVRGAIQQVSRGGGPAGARGGNVGGGLAAPFAANIGAMLAKFLGAPGAVRMAMMQSLQEAQEHPSPTSDHFQEVAGEMGQRLSEAGKDQQQLEKFGVLDPTEAKVQKQAMAKVVEEGAKGLFQLMAKLHANQSDIEEATMVELSEMQEEAKELEQSLGAMKKELGETKAGKELLNSVQERREKIAKQLEQKKAALFGSSRKGTGSELQSAKIASKNRTSASYAKAMESVQKEVASLAKDSHVEMPRLLKVVEKAVKELEGEQVQSGSFASGETPEAKLVLKGLVLAFQKMMMAPLPDQKQFGLSWKKLDGQLGKLAAVLGVAGAKEATALAGMQRNFAAQVAQKGAVRNDASVQNSIAKRGVEGLWILKNRSPVSMLDVSEAMVEMHAQFDMCIQESDRLSSAGYNPEDILMILPKECRPEQLMRAMEELAEALSHSIDVMTKELESLHVEEATQAVSELYFAKALSLQLASHFPMWQEKFTGLFDKPIQKIENLLGEQNG